MGDAHYGFYLAQVQAYAIVRSSPLQNIRLRLCHKCETKSLFRHLTEKINLYRYISKLATLFFTFYFSALIFQSQTWRQFTKVDGWPSNQFLTMIGDQQDNFRVGMPRYISCINEGLANETFQISQGKYGRSEIYCDVVNNGCLCWMW